MKPEDWEDWSSEFMDHIEEKDEVVFESLTEAATPKSEIVVPEEEGLEEGARSVQGFEEDDQG